MADIVRRAKCECLEARCGALHAEAAKCMLPTAVIKLELSVQFSSKPMLAKNAVPASKAAG